jgi:hypothetical protein
MLVLSAQTPQDVSVGRFGMGYPADVADGDQTKDERKSEQSRVGLCIDCVYSQRIQSARGSTFYRCKLSETDPSFPKYPRLPVLQCAGYTRKVEAVS